MNGLLLTQRRSPWAPVQRQKATAKLLVQSCKNVESAHMPRIIIVKLFQVQTKLFLTTFHGKKEKK